MREIILDTETTGLGVGHRIVEIGAVVLEDRWLTKIQFHTYLNPQRSNDPEAFAVHGLSEEFLKDKPLFLDIVDQFLQFIQGADLIMHNASFDESFLNSELKRAGKQYGHLSNHCRRIKDSLKLARQLHPGQRNSLDALCKRYSINNSARVRHGALLDAELLARVYLQMTHAQPNLFEMSSASSSKKSLSDSMDLSKIIATLSLPVLYATDEELRAHETRLLAISTLAETCLWKDKTPI